MSKIIIIDDDATSNYLTELMIKSVCNNCEIISFTNPIEALSNMSTIEVNPETILLIDINMPEINGWEFIKRFEKMGKICKFFILTSSSKIIEQENINKYKNVKYYFTKHLMQEDVREFILEKIIR